MQMQPEYDCSYGPQCKCNVSNTVHIGRWCGAHLDCDVCVVELARVDGAVATLAHLGAHSEYVARGQGQSVVGEMSGGGG